MSKKPRLWFTLLKCFNRYFLIYGIIYMFEVSYVCTYCMYT